MAEIKTDLVRFQELFESVGIKFEPRTDVVGDATLITLAAQTQPKVRGYYGYHTNFEFDTNGGFLAMFIEE